MINDYALVIGLGDYPKYKKLLGSREDAADFHKWLCEPDGGALDPSHAFLVQSFTEPSLGPVQEQVDDALDAIATQSGTGARDSISILRVTGWVRTRPNSLCACPGGQTSGAAPLCA
jgi:hypothetical protein